MEAAAAVVGKSQLADELGWTRPKLDRRLNSDGNFPVRKRGTQRGGWEFDPDEVKRYLDGGPTVEATAKQRLDLAKAVREENRAARESAQLVEAEQVRQVLSTMLARFGKGLDTLPDTISKRLELPAENIEVMRELVDELRRAMVADLRLLLEPKTEQ